LREGEPNTVVRQHHAIHPAVVHLIRLDETRHRETNPEVIAHGEQKCTW